MNIHEYQAKILFKQNGVPVPDGYLATNPTEAEFAMRRLGTEVAVVKAQVHAGGRGKAGGVKLAKSPEECRKITEAMIGMNLITHQAPEGKKVHKVYIEAGSKIVKEYYLALFLDRESAGIGIMFSTEGGMDIEEVAAKTPEKIVTVIVDPTIGLQGHHIRSLCWGMKLPEAEQKELTPIVKNLYKMFIKYDYSMLEINPLIVNDQGKMFALDGKMNFDDNALYRQKEVELFRDYMEEDEREVTASKFGLSYIGLDGNIGCLVNGAGLAMATMDIVKHYGGKPANFLDVGGGASQETVTNAFRILFSDANVKGLFVNIFGGIMRCDVIANGIVAAAKELGLRVPMVVRLEGTNVEQGKEILKKSGLNLYAASDMADGAKKIVELVK
ncbi:MAG TPA: ADP-forming succinate--CoA ligase subunit beta [Oligoflexus sp.]|uniref:ADP-forming succinate--CoA ligase subunit beta n=1 Tax=Oligoflexus sp. TaxID=1971216 RepID=UPI002D7EE94A|nr:ADP-forming succinate--CoA ligase subunit beta [Oligoflexus sp.]HET9241449.1 ADP-forming succinate--CoA ligase subunit beta [Oligoflexus sp.]